MNRRAFIALLGGAAAAWPLAARAQQAAKMRVIGFVGSTTPSAQSAWNAAFVQRLRERGWIEGQTVSIEYKWLEGRLERAADILADFVRRNVDVIVATGTAVAAAKQATTVIPIVFPVAADPLGGGLVASLARPGGNITGLSLLGTDLGPKRLELLREVSLNLRQLAIMGNVGSPTIVLEMQEVQATARALGLDVALLEIRRPDDIAPAFDVAHKHRADALYVCADPLVSTNRVRINTLALAGRLPTMHGLREYVEAGGLMSYGASFPDLFRRSADYVDKILRGAKPADLPVEQPTKFDFVINLTTAKALGLEIPSMLLARADEVIE